MVNGGGFLMQIAFVISLYYPLHTSAVISLQKKIPQEPTSDWPEVNLRIAARPSDVLIRPLWVLEVLFTTSASTRVLALVVKRTSSMGFQYIP
jgi:hypothetical protein